MNIPCQIRVLIVDDEQKAILPLKRILTRAGMLVAIAEGEGKNLFDSAKELAQTFRPHVVVMDYFLYREPKREDPTGLDLWMDPVFLDSQARCILLSSYLNVPIARDALRRDNVDDVISKTDPPKELLKAIQTSVRRSCFCKNSEARLDWPSAWNEEVVATTLFDDGENISPSVVRDVLGRLYPEAKTINLQNMGGEARSPSSIVRGRYVILQAQADDLLSDVVKLAPTSRIMQEIGGYERYIKDRLEGEFHARLKSSRILWDLGAVSYSFLSSPFHDLVLFRDYYRAHLEPSEILRPLNHLFKVVWSRHYLNPTPLDGSLFEAYDRYFSLRERIKELSGRRYDIRAEGIPNSLKDPLHWVLEHERDSHIPLAQAAVTHGDLHGDNIFVDSEHAWAIDFERSGPGPILRDFVELEEDIIVRVATIPEDPPDLFTRFVIDLLSQKKPHETSLITTSPYSLGNTEADKAREVISGIRKLALEVTAYRDVREYYWGLLLDALFGGLLASPYSLLHKRNMMLAALICERLRSWDKPWPLTEWDLKAPPNYPSE